MPRCFAKFGLEQGCRERHARSCRSVRETTIGRCSHYPWLFLQMGMQSANGGWPLAEILLHLLRLQGTRFSSDYCVATLACLAPFPPWGPGQLRAIAAGTGARVASRCARANCCPGTARCPKREVSPAHPIRPPSFFPFLTHSASQQLSTLLFTFPASALHSFKNQPLEIKFDRSSRSSDLPILQILFF